MSFITCWSAIFAAFMTASRDELTLEFRSSAITFHAPFAAGFTLKAWPIRLNAILSGREI